MASEKVSGREKKMHSLRDFSPPRTFPFSGRVESDERFSSNEAIRKEIDDFRRCRWISVIWPAVLLIQLSRARSSEYQHTPLNRPWSVDSVQIMTLEGVKLKLNLTV